jgi:hypothetical protein
MISRCWPKVNEANKQALRLSSDDEEMDDEDDEAEEEVEEEVEEEGGGDVEVIEPKKAGKKDTKVVLTVSPAAEAKGDPQVWDPLQFWRVLDLEIGQQPSSDSWCCG